MACHSSNMACFHASNMAIGSPLFRALDSNQLANNFNEYFTSLGRSTAAVVSEIAKEHNLEAIYEQRTENPPEIQKFQNKKLPISDKR